MLSRNFAFAALALVTGVAGAAPAPQATATYHQVDTIPLDGADGWDYIAVDSSARRLYVSRGTHVAVVDIDANKVVGDIPNTAGVHGIAIDNRDGLGFVSDGRAGLVTVFDLKTLAHVKDVTVGQNPDCILYDSSTSRVFAFNGRSQSASVLDAKSGDVVGTIPLPGKPEFAAADGKGHVYDNIEDQNEIVEIDAKTLKVTNTWPLAPCVSPSGLAIDAKHKRLFAVCDGGKMAVVDAATGKVVATPAIGNGPDAAAFDAGSELAFSSNGEDGTLTVIHENSPDDYDVVQSLTTRNGARTMTVDPKTHHLYTVTADAAPGAPTTGHHRSYVAGTFVVLVYAQ